MNLFFRINDVLITSPTSDSILDGITRKSIIEISKSMGLQVLERDITVSELLNAYKSGELKEIFGTGTAVVVLPINSFSHQKETYILPNDTSLANSLKKTLMDIQYNKSEDHFNWRKTIV